MAENPNKISQIQIGSVTYDICDAIARNHTIIDDDYVIVDNNFPTTNETKTYGGTKGFYVHDSTGEIRIGLKPVSYEDGRQGVSVVTGRKINDSNIYNEVFLGIKPDGSRTVRLSEAAPWRTALELGTTAPGTVLWSGAWYMAGNQTANLSADITTCPSGVVLHWQPYADGNSLAYNHNYTFIPKNYPFTQGLSVMLIGNGMNNLGCKYVYIHNNKIDGNDLNDDTGTSSGITYNNKYWVLTQVIAV